MKTLDSTKDLLSDIISWEKDLSEYESLESILRRKYCIQKRDIELKPITEITDSDCILVCAIAEPMPFTLQKSKWDILRNQNFITVSNKKNYFSFTIDLVNGDLTVYDNCELKTTDNMGEIVVWYFNNGYDCLIDTTANPHPKD